MKIEKIEDISKKFPKRLVLFSRRVYSGTLYDIVDVYLSENKDKKLIWFETDNPSEKILEELKERELDVSRVYFVDLISKASGREREEEKNESKFSINNPDDMVDISMTLSDLFDDESVSLAIINTINGLLAFNSIENIKKFIRFLSKIAYSTNTTILICYYPEEYPKELEEALKICCDAYIKESEGKELEIVGD